jgi:predicted MFS family arabinose efflux permease
VISVLLVSYLVVCWAFMPLFLTKHRGFAPETMGWLMATLGISAGIGSFVVPAISDAIGRRPVMIFFAFLGAILPLGGLYYGGSPWVLGAIFFFGWGSTACSRCSWRRSLPKGRPAPDRHADRRGHGHRRSSGRGAQPVPGRHLADAWGLSAPLWLMLVLTILAGLCALGLVRSAPRIVARRSGAVGAAALT